MPWAAACLMAAACGADRDPGGGAARAAPSIEARDTAGLVQWIAAHKGVPVLVNFWATWCGPCIAELPDLLDSTRDFRARGGIVVGVAMEQFGADLTVDQAVAKARAKAAELGLDFPVLVCTDDEMKVVRKVLGVELGGLPQTLGYDRTGSLVVHHEGVATAEEFTAIAQRTER